MSAERAAERRISVLLSSHGANLYGAERNLLALGKGLVRRGHTVTFEIPHPGALVDLASEVQGLCVVVSGRSKPPRRVASAYRYAAEAPASARAISRLIKKEGIEVAWINSLTNPIAAMGARISGVPAFWHLQERNFSGVAGAAAAAWIRMTGATPVAISEFVADSFRGHSLVRRRIRVVPHALMDQRRPPLRGSRDPFRVAFVGQLIDRKRPADLIRAVASLKDVEAVLLGDGPLRSSLEHLTLASGAPGRIRFLGFQRDVRRHLEGCACMVVPSVDEPFGLVALEGMEAGLPMVSARSGGLPEVLGDAALYFPPRDWRALAGVVNRLRESPELAEDLVQRAEGRLRRFGFEDWVSEIEGILLDAAHA